MATGENLQGMEAYAYVEDPESPRRMSLLIATERVDNMVLVRMEAA
jgi:hypothetical protein